VLVETEPRDKITFLGILRRYTRCWAPVATQEAEIRRILVGSQPGQIVPETLSRKYPIQNRAGGVAQVVESLPSKCEALSSILYCPPNKRRYARKWKRK
jgi:hypothetical protein